MELAELRRDIEHMPSDMASFFFSMRSLYTGEAFKSNSVAAVKFRRLRDDTRNDAISYLDEVLPASVAFVTSVREWFKHYEVLDEEGWSKSLENIIQITTLCQQNCEELLVMNNDMLVRLKQRQDEAGSIVRELKDLQLGYRRKMRELEKKADVKRDWAIGLAFIPLVNLIATPILLQEAHNDSKEAADYGFQAGIEEAATHAIQRSLIPALQSFIDGLHKAADFFQTNLIELGKFRGKGEKSLENKKKFHYKPMRAEAKKMDAACQRFYSIIPVVETDQRVDQNYRYTLWIKQIHALVEKGNNFIL